MSPARPLTLALALQLTGCYTSPELGTSDTDAASSGPQGTTGADPSSGGPGSSGLSGGASSGDASSGGAEATDGSTGEGASSTGDPAVPPDCPRVKVVVMQGNTLNVRPDPSTAGAPVGELAGGAIVDVVALVQGELVEGSDLWYEITSPDVSGFIFSGYAQCTLEEPPELQPPAGYYLPLECGKTASISQGNFGDFSHQGKAAYAFDFSIGLDTPMVAMADGVVIHTFSETGPGDPCYGGGGQECFPYANLVVLLHGDGSATLYKHLNEVHVALDEFVPRGQLVGLSGSTGYSTGPHAHTMRMEDCGAPNCQSIPLQFVDVPGDGVPDTDQSVTSQNCP